ncbi:MAG TPA: sensor histidine kinase [Myxococcota bacterium]|nr:sensor histidine kinase [Myxococcota bacterium]
MELPTLFDRVVLGLLLNAAQAGARSVAVRAEAGTLVVEDDGPGVPEELREQIFEPFFTTKAWGTGLGLAMARRLVEADGGTLSLQSSGGFRIQLE